jgi:phosphoglycerate dehydrogenase-like enzyme
VKKKAAFVSNDWWAVDRVYKPHHKARLAELTDLFRECITRDTMAAHSHVLRETEVIFSTWGFPTLTDGDLAQYFPKLKAVFYGAGSVQGFARPLLARGVTLVSAWGANAGPVADFVVSQILLACKGYFRNVREFKATRNRRAAYVGPGPYAETVAILGAGMVGRRVSERLQGRHLNLLVYDPFLSDAHAAALGVTKVPLAEAFARAYVISNHLANKPETQRILNGEMFRRMRDEAVFINTGRGASVDEEELIAELKRRPTLTALLDVTDPEPPAADSELFALPNVLLSTHLAGALDNECAWLADCCIAEFEAWQSGQPLHCQVTPDMLDTMA